MPSQPGTRASQGEKVFEHEITRYYTADEYNLVNVDFEKRAGQILDKIGSRDTTPDIFYSPQAMSSKETSPDPTREQGRNETNALPYLKQLSQRSFVELLDDGHLKWTHDGTRDWAKTCLKSLNTHILFNIVDSEEAEDHADPLVPLDEDRSESEVLKQWTDEDRPQLQALDKKLKNYDVFLKFGYFKMIVLDTKTIQVKGRTIPFVAVIQNGSGSSPDHWYTGGRRNLHEDYAKCETLKALAETLKAQIKDHHGELELPNAYSSQSDALPVVGRAI